MSDLISRQAAIDAVEALAYHADKYVIDSDVHEVHGFRTGLAVAERQLSLVPSVQPERKKGKWIEIHGFCTPGGDPVWACSECGKGVHVYGIEHGTYGADVSDGQWKACPNCGCRMEGEEHD